MTSYDNAPPLPDWSVQPTQHCGEWCLERTCSICNEYVPLDAPGIIRGEN